MKVYLVLIKRDLGSLALRIIHLIYDALYPLLSAHNVRFLRTSIHLFAKFLFSQPIRTCNTFRASSRRKLRVKPSYRGSPRHSHLVYF